MSKVMTNKAMTNKAMTNQRKPLCKVCQDAGKPENIYTSHYTRESADPKSKVTCPTLLALECRYCFKKGHTVKYCGVLAANKKQQEKAAQHQEQKQQEQKQKQINKANVFDALLEDDDEDQEQTQEQTQPQEKEEFPALVAPKQQQQQGPAVAAATMSYATMASKPATFVKQQQVSKTTTTWAEEEEEEEDNDEYEEALYKARLAVIMEKSYKPTIYGKASELDWAATEQDSDDEDW